MLEYFSLRLDPESVKTLEEIASKTGIAPSTLARNCVKVILTPRMEPSLVEQAIQRAKTEKVKDNGTDKT